MFLLRVGCSKIGSTLFRVFHRHLVAIGSRIDRLLKNKLVPVEIAWCTVLNLRQSREEFLFSIENRNGSDVQRRVALQRIIRHGVDCFNNLAVIFERVVNKKTAAGFVFGHLLLKQVDALLRKMNIQR